MRRKASSRIMALLMSIIMIVGMLPMTAFAANDLGQVRVIVENTVYTKEAGAAWDGVLVDKWVNLNNDSTMMSCFVDALGSYSQTGAESNYISEVNGLAAFDGGSMSGWMGTLNDWFTNEGFGAFTVADGKLSAGDEIRIMYTLEYGNDLGGSWGDSDKTVKDIFFSAGTLSPSFHKNTHNYTLEISSDVDSVVVTPTASNKNYQVRTSVDGKEYKRTASVPVNEGTVITVKCGDPTWPSMNGNSGEAQVYQITVGVSQDQSQIDQAAANTVIDLINAIGSVSIDSGDAISAARIAYDNLTQSQQELVSNYTVLTAAEEAYKKLSQASSFDEVYKSTGDYLVSLGTPGVGSIGGEWAVIGLARSDREVAEGYYKAVLQFVKEEINDAEQLHSVKSTENSRIILALTALGLDVTNVGGHNLLQGLTDMGYVTAQGINGPIWALIAFDSASYEIPVALEGAEQVTREKLITYILEKQLTAGGWALFGSTADPDMTAMALQALAPYYDSNSEVKAAVDKALTCLSEMQRDDGGLASWGTVNAESCAQVIVALTALGIDPDSDPRFIKNGRSVLDALLTFAVDGGGFKHIASGSINGMATEQGYYALVSYDRFLNGKTSLYDMSDVTSGTDKPPIQEDKDIILNDVNGSGITVVGKESILHGMEMEANLLTSGSLYDKVRETVKEGKFSLYDLYLLENNLEVQPGGMVTVSIPVPSSYDGAQCKVYRVNADGSMTEIAAALKNGKLVFEADQMGAFAVYQHVKANMDDPVGNDNMTNPGDGGSNGVETPQTGDDSHVAMYLLVPACLLALPAVLVRKKRQQNQ